MTASLATASGSSYFVDCAAGSDSNAGTSSAAAWKSLPKVNSASFNPGDQIFFKRGTSCIGTLAPSGSGALDSPITIDAYGTGTKPLIAGSGAKQAVRLHNQQWWEIRNLEITNTGQAVGNRRGVSVELEDFGKASHIVLENLDVHNVNGDDTKDTGGSGGIYFTVIGTAVQTWFDGVTVANNTVRSVDREGIFMVSTWNRSGFETASAGVFVPWPNVVIRGNQLSDLGGDGIVPGNTTGALVERNYLNGFQKRSAGYNAGMWTYDSDNTVFQYNETTGGQTTRDGMAYDVDQGTVNVTFQYNYSHDNAGGFMLLCNATGILRGAVVRYNISQNDSYRGVENCSGTIESADIYNNTFYIGAGKSQVVVNENNTTKRTVKFRNNIVLTAPTGSASFNLKSGGYQLDHNVIHQASGVPNGAGLSSDPLLVAAGSANSSSSADGYQLCQGSPAISAGVEITNNGGRDYFGNAVIGTPTIGAYGGAGIPCSLLSDGGFESGTLNSWATRNASISSVSPHTGGYAAKLAATTAGTFATIERKISGLQPSTKYLLTGWVITNGSSTQIGVKGHGGAQLATASRATQWTSLQVPFSTGSSSSSATIFCYLPQLGASTCDDFSLTATG